MHMSSTLPSAKQVIKHVRNMVRDRNVIFLWDVLHKLDMDTVDEILDMLSRVEGKLISIRIPAYDKLLDIKRDNPRTLTQLLKSSTSILTPEYVIARLKCSDSYVWWDGGTNYVIECLKV